jgi:hypothetical protein
VDFQNHTIGHPYHRHFQLFAGGGILLSSHCAVHTAVSLETLLPRVAPPRRELGGCEEACIVLAIYGGL